MDKTKGIKAIVCAASDWGIGKANGLLFSIPYDMAFFRTMTTGNIVVMGYSTYLSIGKPLKNRVNVVLWDKATGLDSIPGCITFSQFDPLLRFVKILATNYNVFIIGGASVYKLFLPYYDAAYVNRVAAKDPEATAFFPDLAMDPSFRLASVERVPDNEDTNGYILDRCIYEAVE